MTKILCVEDEVDIRQILAEELTDVGYEVFEAGDGRQGLEVIVDKNPDLVLCDITMPVMDGHSMLTELRDNHPEQADTPFIFLSALADRDHILQGKSLGADDYLTKPVDIDMLLATIDSRLRQIARMTKRKEEQLVKLYKSFNNTGSNDGETTASEEPANGVCQTDLNDREADVKLTQDGPEPEADVSQQQEASKTRDTESERTNAEESTAPSFTDRVRNLLQNGQNELFVARAALAGLDDVKASLGNQWSSQVPVILGVAAEQLTEFAPEPNIVEPRPDESFLIVFGPTSDSGQCEDWEPTANCFRKKLSGQDSLDKRIKDRGALRLDCRRISLSTEEVEGCDDVAELILTRLFEPALPAGQEEKDALAAELKDCRIVQVPVMAAKGNQTALTTTRFDNRTQVAIAVVTEAGYCDGEVFCRIDCTKLAKVAALIDANAQTSQPSLIVDVHYSTMKDTTFSAEFLATCRDVGQAVMRNLVLNLRDLPSQATNEQIGPIIDALRGFGCKVLIGLEQISIGQIDPPALKISITIGDYCNLGPQLGDNSGLKELISDLHNRKTLFLMQNVPNAEVARELFGLGVDLAALN